MTPALVRAPGFFFPTGRGTTGRGAIIAPPQYAPVRKTTRWGRADADIIQTEIILA
jgi:hypothetical protein